MKKYICDLCLNELDTLTDDPEIVWGKYLGYRFQDVCLECREELRTLEVTLKADMLVEFNRRLDIFKQTRQLQVAQVQRTNVL